MLTEFLKISHKMQPNNHIDYLNILMRIKFNSIVNYDVSQQYLKYIGNNFNFYCEFMFYIIL